MMKGILVLISIFALCFSCDRDDDDTIGNMSESNGVILGIDMSLCACCGGYLVKFQDQNTTYNFSSLPEDSGIDLATEAFPLAIKAYWTGSASKSCTNIIRINNIVKR